ncbi:MAG: hypothetical protein B6I24_03055 [Bacteroidetes bacterium 4572_128]|nr:MAG: hypothetical protein B6I24_03055 [Bacteroidetes bacterium 4572_128]
MISEIFIQYIWGNNLFHKTKYLSSLGQKIEIIDVGKLNNNSGADFSDAKIKINNLIFAGDIEIHKKSSDWFAHLHHKNKAYDNVILHVVCEHNKEIFNTKQTNIPTIILECEKLYLENSKIKYKKNFITNLESLEFEKIIKKNLLERMDEKSNLILERLKINKGDWKLSFYQILLKNFGLNVNNQAFELLSFSLDLNILLKHKNNIFQLEALLFGQAGFLEKNYKDIYVINLKKEYIFLKKKFSLIPLEEHIWKFFRIRPCNFPTIRISQFAKLFASENLFSKIINSFELKVLKKYFEIPNNDYWNNNYFFDKKYKSKNKNSFGKSSQENLIINTIIPFWIAWGKQKNNVFFLEKSIEILKKLKPENNKIIRNYKKLGIKIPNSYYSQAILQINKKLDL